MGYAISGGNISAAKKVIIYGPEGIGKTTFAARFPDPVFIDTEHSSDAYDVRRFPHPTSWSMLIGEVEQVRDDPSCCKTLVIDTADWAERLEIEWLCAKHKWDGLEGAGYGRGFQYSAEEIGRLLNRLSEIVEKGVHVVLTAHAQLQKFEQPDEMGSYDRWAMKTSKKVAPLLREWCDLLLFANYKTYAVAADNSGKKFKAQGGKRVMYTSHHPCWDAKNRYGLPDELPFEFEHVSHLFTDQASSARQPAPAQAVRRPSAPAPRPTSIEDDILPPSAPAAESPSQPSVTVSADPEQFRQENKADLIRSGIPERLAALMAANDVTEEEIQYVVGTVRGYFPTDMPIRDYPADFIEGVLIGAWDQVYKVVDDSRDLPFG